MNKESVLIMLIILCALLLAYPLITYIKKTIGYLFMKPDDVQWLNKDEYKHRFIGLTPDEAQKHLEASKFRVSLHNRETGTVVLWYHWPASAPLVLGPGSLNELHEKVFREYRNLLIDEKKLNKF